VSAFIDSLPKDYGVDSAWLFGSWAEGRQRVGSDVDIGIVLRRGVDWVTKMDLFSRALDFDPDFHAIAFSLRDYEREDAVVVHLMKTKGIRVA
jgi:predicted nucleotidyltransferase